MKYIDAEKLIAEIERRIESWTIRGEHSPAGQGRDTCVSRVTELSDLLSFVTSLQQEQPEVDLEKEIEKGWEELEKDYSPSALDKSCMIVSGLIGEKQFSRIARHFYNLGLNARKK